MYRQLGVPLLQIHSEMTKSDTVNARIVRQLAKKLDVTTMADIARWLHWSPQHLNSCVKSQKVSGSLVHACTGPELDTVYHSTWGLMQIVDGALCRIRVE